MNILIPVPAIQAARKLLTRIRFERLKLPVLNHVLATVDAAGLTLAVTDLDHWLETRIAATINPDAPGRFLIPAAALAAAVRGDKKSTVRFDTSGTADTPGLKLTVTCGGMPVESVHQPVAADQFPERLTLDGRITAVPKETFQALQTVAPCASTDATRYVLNGVLFSPDDGGTLIATDGKLLAGAPARFAGREFILPSAAVHVLAFPDFTARDAALLPPAKADNPHVQFRSGPPTLIARTIEGNYPNYRQVIPHEFLAEVTIPETHRAAVISWLKSLDGRSPTVRLTWETPGHLTLTHWDSGAAQATIRVPVSTSGGGEGQPPTISFAPQYLAEALAIGPVLRLIDGISPGVATGPSGNFCVIMPCRCVVEDAKDAGDKAAGSAAATPAMAA